MPLTNRQECRKTYLHCAAFQKMVRRAHTRCILSISQSLPLSQNNAISHLLSVVRLPCARVCMSLLLFFQHFSRGEWSAALNSHARPNIPAKKIEWRGCSLLLMQCKKCWAAASSVATNAHCTLNSFDRNHTSFASLNFRTMQVINYYLFGVASSYFPVFALNGSPLQTNRHKIRIRKLMHRHNSAVPFDGTSIITIENKFWRGISNRQHKK